MVKVSTVIEELKKYPPDARVYAYEGEVIGIVIVSGEREGRPMRELGFIPASERDELEDAPKNTAE